MNGPNEINGNMLYELFLLLYSRNSFYIPSQLQTGWCESYLSFQSDFVRLKTKKKHNVISLMPDFLRIKVFINETDNPIFYITVELLKELYTYLHK